MLQPAVALFVVGMFMCTSPQAEGASTGISLAPASVRNEDGHGHPAVAPRALNGAGSAAGRAPVAAPSTLPRQESGSAVNLTPQTRTGGGAPVLADAPPTLAIGGASTDRRRRDLAVAVGGVLPVLARERRGGKCGGHSTCGSKGGGMFCRDNWGVNTCESCTGSYPCSPRFSIDDSCDWCRITFPLTAASSTGSTSYISKGSYYCDGSRTTFSGSFFSLQSCIDACSGETRCLTLNYYASSNICDWCPASGWSRRSSSGSGVMHMYQKGAPSKKSDGATTTKEADAKTKEEYVWTAVGIGATADQAAVLGNPKEGGVVTEAQMVMIKASGKWDTLVGAKGVEKKRQTTKPPGTRVNNDWPRSGTGEEGSFTITTTTTTIVTTTTTTTNGASVVKVNELPRPKATATTNTTTNTSTTKPTTGTDRACTCECACGNGTAYSKVTMACEASGVSSESGDAGECESTQDWAVALMIVFLLIAIAEFAYIVYVTQRTTQPEEAGAESAFDEFPDHDTAAEDALGAATTATTKTATTTNITAASADALYDSATALGAFVNFVDNAGYVDVSAAEKGESTLGGFSEQNSSSDEDELDLN